MFEWSLRSKAKNVSVSGPLLMKKALESAEKMNLNDFTASKGWLQRFKKRFNIVLLIVSGERGRVDMDAAKEWMSPVPDLIKGCAARDIFNMNETGLFYRVLPERSLSFKGEACTDG